MSILTASVKKWVLSRDYGVMVVIAGYTEVRNDCKNFPLAIFGVQDL